MSETVKSPIFKRGDLDASIGTFFDGFSKVIVAISILVGTFGLEDVVFGQMMPGLFIGVLIMNGGLWLYYRNEAKRLDKPDLTAIPAGLQAGRIFIWLFSIMLPVYNATGDAMLAFRVGVLANLVGGIVFIIGAYVVPYILKVVPTSALFGTLAGGAMAFMVLQSMDGVLQMPLVGWVSMIVLFVIYLAKVNVKLPASLIAIVIGAAIAWGTGQMNFGDVTASISNLGLNLPSLDFGIFSSTVFSEMVKFLPIIIVFSLNEVITGIQAVEQAIESGDDYFDVEKPLVICGIASVVSALFGNPLALGLFWGYPGWKEVDAGTGYHLGDVVLYGLVSITGLTAIINAFIPEATVLPILIFVGMSSFSQAFEVVEHKYYPALIMASLPVVMDFITNNTAEGALLGYFTWKSGSAFVGLVVGCLIAFIIDKGWFKAGITSVAGLILTVLGMIHSPGVILTDGYVFETEFVVIYIVTAVAFFIMHVINFNKTEEEIELEKRQKQIGQEG